MTYYLILATVLILGLGILLCLWEPKTIQVPLATTQAPSRGVVIPMVITAYCVDYKRPHACDPLPKRPYDGLTATGKLATIGDCAADWSIFPPGTVFYVPGYGRCVVEDKGKEVKGLELDVFMESAWGAQMWGRQTLPVTLIQYGR